MSNTIKTSAATSRPPSAYQLEKSMSLWMQLSAQMETDPDFIPDEAEIEQRIKDAGLRSPFEMLSSLIDTAIVMDQKADHAETLRKRYQDKRDRYKARVERTKTTIDQMMQILETTAHEAELGSAGMYKARKHVVITDMAKLAERFVRRADPEPKKVDIAAAIKAGETVEGAEMSGDNAPPALRIVPF